MAFGHDIRLALLLNTCFCIFLQRERIFSFRISREK